MSNVGHLNMLSLNDPRWRSLTGGYKKPYDASMTLERLERGENVWSELWEELHHQGDVGTASYAAVPHIVRIAISQRRRDWNSYAFVATVEVERLRGSNPDIPEWTKQSYTQAIQDLASLALVELESTNDDLLVRSALGLVALARGSTKLGMLISIADSSEIDEILEGMYGFGDDDA
jgi:hypothetical protein